MKVYELRPPALIRSTGGRVIEPLWVVSYQDRIRAYQKLARDTADVYQQRILDGELVSGQMITSTQIAREFGVSLLTAHDVVCALRVRRLVRGRGVVV